MTNYKLSFYSDIIILGIAGLTIETHAAQTYSLVMAETGM